MDNKLENAVSPATPIPQELQSGVRFAKDTSVTASPPPETVGLPRETTHIGVKGIAPGDPPSSFQNTNRPFLARILDIPVQIIDRLELRDSIMDIDGFILDLVKERNWVDNDKSYQDILDELRVNLGIHKNVETFSQIERLLHGVKLLRLQKMHARRAKEIQEIINKQI